MSNYSGKKSTMDGRCPGTYQPISGHIINVRCEMDAAMIDRNAQRKLPQHSLHDRRQAHRILGDRHPSRMRIKCVFRMGS